MHSDPEVLAMIAMGEIDIPADDRRHVESCAQCSSEIVSLRRIPDIARAGVPDGPLAAPRAAVWSQISSTLAFPADVQPAPFEPMRAAASATVVAQPDAGPSRQGSSAPAPAVPVDISRASGRRRSRARRRWIPLLAAAAVVAVAGGVATTVVLTREPASTVLADVELRALPAWNGARGEAVVKEAPDGSRDVAVTVDLPATGDGYREVWLLTPDLSGLISIGVLTSDDATFAVPAGVDLDEYSVVDVSAEHVDGDPAHSGDSIVRGSIKT